MGKKRTDASSCSVRWKPNWKAWNKAEKWFAVTSVYGLTSGFTRCCASWYWRMSYRRWSSSGRLENSPESRHSTRKRRCGKSGGERGFLYSAGSRIGLIFKGLRGCRCTGLTVLREWERFCSFVVRRKIIHHKSYIINHQSWNWNQENVPIMRM